MPELRLETREARRKLARDHDVYWRSVGKGLAVGYRKPPFNPAKQKQPGPAIWYVRKFNGQSYSKRTLGEADDDHPADGQFRLSWNDALVMALDEPQRAANTKLKYTVRECFEGYFANRADETHSNSSVDEDQGRVEPFLKKFGDRYINDLTTAELKLWRRGLLPADIADSDEDDDDGIDEPTEAEVRETKRKAKATANRIWNPIRAALNWAFNEEWATSDAAWRRVKAFRKVDRPKLRFLSVSEVKRALAASPPDFRLLVNGAVLTGMRLGELNRLTVGDVVGRAINVPAGKVGVGRIVPITPEGVSFFSQLRKGKHADEPLFRDADGDEWYKMKVKRAMDEMNAKARLQPRATFRDLRRTYGSLLANAGARDSVIATALGHSDTRTTRKHYAHLLDKSVARDVSKLLPRFDGKAKAINKRRAKA